MPFQPVPNVTEFTFRWHYTDSGYEPECTVYVASESPRSGTEILSGCEAAAGAYATNIAPLAYADAPLIQVHGRDLTEEFGAFAETDVSIAGELGGTWLPPNCAALIRFKPLTGGPPREGGIFHPFVLESWCSNVGVLSGDALTLDSEWDFVIGSIRSSIGDLGSEHVIVTRYSKTAWIAAHPGYTPEELAAAKPWPREPQATHAVVATYSVETRVASQRNRRGR